MAKDKKMGSIKSRLDPANFERKRIQRREKIKNKNIRKISRGTIFRSKDTKKMLDEMYELDEQEYILSQNNANGQENVVKEKRRKLKDMLEKVLLFHQRDNKEKYEEIKKWQFEYEMKRRNIKTDMLERNKLKAEILLTQDPLKHILPNIPLPNESDIKKNNSEYFNAQLTPCLKGNKKQIPFLPANILPPGPPPVLPPHGSVPVPLEILNQMIETIKPAQPIVYPQYSYNYFYDSLPPPPPPPKKRYTSNDIVINTPVIATYQNTYSSQDISNIEIYDAVTPSVISADPKLKDMQAEVTKLIPISVLRKREEKKPSIKLISDQISSNAISKSQEIKKTEDQDKAYLAFVNQINYP